VERRPQDLAPDPARFAGDVDLVRGYVRSDAGSHAALMAAARQDPEGMTTSLVTLGAVLLDIASAAFDLTPDQMLDKVAQGIADHRGAQRAGAGPRSTS
jgi:hypothetical protein